jgi:leucyl-tRNA synthetase
VGVYVVGLVPVGSISMAGAKMSKSLGNYVVAGPVLDQFGADALRLAMISVRDPSGHTSWEQYDLAGSNRFIRRVWRLAEPSGSSLDIAVDTDAVECNRAAHRLAIRMKEVIESGRL